MRAASWRLWFPAAVLVAVAAVQIVLVQTAHLTPWKGGGFGMFAAVDGGAVRSMRIQVDGPERSERLDVPPSLEIDAERALALPIRPLLANLAEKVAAREARRGQPVTRVTVEAWSASLSDDGSQAESHRLGSYVLDVLAGQP
jgi:hypothetical protein